MTREQIKNKIEVYIEVEPHSRQLKDIELFVDKIFDVFESRTCGNCNWYKDDICYNYESPLCADYISSDFGCILWGSKDD